MGAPNSFNGARAKLRTGLVNLLFAAAILTSCAPLTAAANIDLKPGKYTLTITYQIQDQRQNESRTGTRCIAPADLGDPEKIFNDRMFAPGSPDTYCAVKNLKTGGGQISYDADCQDRVVHVEGTLSNTEFSVVREVKPKASPGVSLKLALRGKRTGDCGK